jgi:DNA-binding MarR family transcriptional regulator
MQKKPPPPALESIDCNCQALRQAARHVSQIYDSHLAAEGLKTSQYSILAKLGRLGPQSINEMAKLMVMDRTTLGRAVKPLERDKLLTIAADDDARRRKLKLTGAGETRLKAAAARWREAQKEFELAFGVPESAEMRTVLRRVVASTGA